MSETLQDTKRFFPPAPTFPNRVVFDDQEIYIGIRPSRFPASRSEENDFFRRHLLDNSIHHIRNNVIP